MVAVASSFPVVDPALLERYEIAAPRYTSYPTVPEWSELSGDEYGRRLVAAGSGAARGEPLSLYVHLPFCEELCSYCGCNVVVARNRTVADSYLDRVLAEIALAADRLGSRRTFDQLHYGGGTPTFLSEEQLERLYAGIRKYFTPTMDAELAIEVDPVVTTRSQLALLRSQGFNRLSLGVQDLDPVVQAAVRRIQTVEQTQAVVDAARELGFTGINFDLIYGLPHQTKEGFARTMEQVLAMRPDRAAVYSFAYLPSQRTHQSRIEESAVPTGGRKLELFATAYDAFVHAGYRPIGMDHFAHPTDDLARAQAEKRLGRNFQGYTARRVGDVIAFGATAISDVAGVYAQNVRPLNKYYAAIDQGEFATERGIVTTADDRARRAIISSLMCNFFVDLGEHGRARYARAWEALERLEREGLVHLDGSTITLTSLGTIFVRNVASVFDAYLGRSERLFSKAV